MVAHVHTIAFTGIDVLHIDVQVHLASGLPAFTIVGLPDKAVGESRERVRSALQAIGLSLPVKRITVNLSPADVVKEGSHFDLPIALGLLSAMGVVPQDYLDRFIAMGELGLDGRLTQVSGTLPAAVAANGLDKGLICPQKNGGEAAWAGEIELLAPANLLELINHIKGNQILTPPTPSKADAQGRMPDLRDVRGQETAKRCLEVAASGGHHLLLCGPPGAGKSMLASRLPGILPPLLPQEALETSMIHSVAGNLEQGAMLRARPYRDPHHSASLVALVGGGHRAKPGEISLAHNGVLFLDELPEFNRSALEALRQPIETGYTSIARANAHVTYPCRFQLVAAMNPCRCGYMSDVSQACSRAPKCGQEYQGRISGPLFDRFDLQLDVEAVRPQDLHVTVVGEDTKTVAERVAAVRGVQRERYADYGFTSNAQLDGALLQEYALPDAKGQALLGQAAEHFKLSARAYNRVLRVARTLADMAGRDAVCSLDIGEALGFRRHYTKLLVG
jgi:magnesium chelatase family protein